MRCSGSQTRSRAEDVAADRKERSPVLSSLEHPCEILAEMYALSRIRKDFIHDKYLFCGNTGNIGFTWKEASKLWDLSCRGAAGHAMEGLEVSHD